MYDSTYSRLRLSGYKRMKITKKQLKLHEQVEDVLWGSDKLLTWDEQEFVFRNYDPRADHRVGKIQSYFTPYEIAATAMCYVGDDGRKIVDIGAGIGVLSHRVLRYVEWTQNEIEVWAIELNPEFVRVGKRILPEINWICGDALDKNIWAGLPVFDEIISNPPFGNLETDTSTDWIGYQGPGGLTFAAISLLVAHNGGTLIMPQVQTPYKVSGRKPYDRSPQQCGFRTKDGKRFKEAYPDCEWSVWCEDMTSYDGWRGSTPTIEIVTTCDWSIPECKRPQRSML